MFSTWTLKRTLIVGFLVTAALAGVVGTIASHRLSVMVGHLEEILLFAHDSQITLKPASALTVSTARLWSP